MKCRVVAGVLKETVGETDWRPIRKKTWRYETRQA